MCSLYLKVVGLWKHQKQPLWGFLVKSVPCEGLGPLTLFPGDFWDLGLLFRPRDCTTLGPSPLSGLWGPSCGDGAWSPCRPPGPLLLPAGAAAVSCQGLGSRSTERPQLRLDPQRPYSWWTNLLKCLPCQQGPSTSPLSTSVMPRPLTPTPRKDHRTPRLLLHT